MIVMACWIVYIRYLICRMHSACKKEEGGREEGNLVDGWEERRAILTGFFCKCEGNERSNISLHLIPLLSLLYTDLRSSGTSKLKSSPGTQSSYCSKRTRIDDEGREGAKLGGVLRTFIEQRWEKKLLFACNCVCMIVCVWLRVYECVCMSVSERGRERMCGCNPLVEAIVRSCRVILLDWDETTAQNRNTSLVW